LRRRHDPRGVIAKLSNIRDPYLRLVKNRSPRDNIDPPFARPKIVEGPSIPSRSSGHHNERQAAPIRKSATARNKRFAVPLSPIKGLHCHPRN
jgi:hypothetical protein